MPAHDLHALAQIKLVELRRQRASLAASYAALERRALADDRPLAERVDAVAAGLAALRFAQTPLHPGVAVIDTQLAVLRTEAAAGRADDELLARALSRLLAELAQGRTRVEFAQLFGELIEEHLAAQSAPDEEARADGALLALITTAPEGGDDVVRRVAAWYEGLGARSPGAMETLRKRLGEEGTWAPLVRMPQAATTRALLEGIAAGPLRSPAVRAAASEAAANPTTVGEYNDVLTILLDRRDDWDWPASGVPLRAEWDHGKCRVGLDEGLLSLLFLDHVGHHFARGVGQWRAAAGVSATAANPGAGLFAPPVPPAADVGADAAGVAEFYRRAALHELDLDLATQANELALVSLPTEIVGYDGGARASSLEERTHQQHLLAALQSQIVARRALHPERPLYVLQFDLRDFFPSISHDVMLAALAALGLGRPWLRLIARYLDVPARYGGESRSLRRGLPVGRTLAWALGELLLLPLEPEVHHATGLRMLRVVDDAVLLSDDPELLRRAWSVVQDFVRDFGLAVHPEKSGAVRLEPLAGGAAGADDDLRGLPGSLPRWGALRLHADAVWRPDEARVEALRAWTRERVGGARSLLEMVSRYNAELTYAMRQLGVTVFLGAAHVRSVAGVIARFHQDLFGPGRGVREALLERARERLPGDSRRGDAVLPTALLHWPVTAGGLGLTQPMIAVHGLQAAAESASKNFLPPERPKPEVIAAVHRQLQRLAARARAGGADAPDREELAARAAEAVGPLTARARFWLNHAVALRTPLVVAAPATTPELTTLTREFIQRGTELGGREQKGLSAYWRWVLHTYGPPLLDAVGSFRFLLTELVPLPLLLGTRGPSRRADAEPPEPDERRGASDDIPF